LNRADHQKAKWSGCADQNDYCRAWAATGECEKNPGYMASNCRLACKLCSPPAEGGAKPSAPEAVPAY